MENPRPEKVAVVDEVRDRLSGSSAALLTEYRGINVKDMATLRRALRDAGGDYKIYKNTLVRFAVRDLGIEGVDDLLVGTTAIAFVQDDAAAVAKALRDFARTNPNLVVKGGLLGDKVLGASDVGALAELPPREVLLARLAGGLAAPLQQLAGLIQALPRNFAYGLKALIDQGGNPGVAETAAPAAPEPEPAAAEPEPASAPEAAAAEPEPAAGEPEAAAAEPEAAPEAAADPGEGETRPEENPKPEPSEQEPAEGAPETTDDTPTDTGTTEES